MMTPTLFSVSYAGAWGQHQLGVLDFLAKAAALGYAAVELGGKRPHLSVLDYPDESSLLPIRDAARRLGIEIATVATYTDFTASPHAAEVPFAEMQVHYVASLCRMAKTLGARLVRVFSGYYTGTASFAADWERCVQALRASAEVAAGHGVTLGLQNHHDVGVSVAAFEELLNEVDHPNLKAMFDPWSPALHGEDLHASARRLAPRMVQTTLADYLKFDRFHYRPELINYERLDPPAVRAVPLGEGFLDLEGFFAGLKEGGFDGYVAYEMCSPLRGGGSEANLDATARKSLKKIQELIGSWK
jgi:sugar phosphate isomerase/epimerase